MAHTEHCPFGMASLRGPPRVGGRFTHSDSISQLSFPFLNIDVSSSKPTDCHHHDSISSIYRDNMFIAM